MILRKAVGLFAAIGMAVIVSSANADIIRFDIAGIGGAGLLTTNELHGPSGNATGGERGLGILYDDVTMDLMVDVGWGTGNGFADLTGNATGMHIHGPANQNSTAGVVFNLSIQGPPAFDNDAAGGGFTGTVNLNAAQEAILLSGNFYINVHTSANTSGEIRGNLFAIPEPNSIALVFGLIAAGGFMTRRRK